MFDFIRFIPGPDFLLYYFLYFAGMVFVYRVIAARMDTTVPRPFVQPEKESAIEIAYLKNPNNKMEILKIILFGLCQKGFLTLSEDAKAQLTDKAAVNRDELNDLEKNLLGFFPEKIGVAAQKALNSREIAPFFDGIRKRLISKKLLKNSEDQKRERSIRWLFYLLAFFPGFVKLFFGIAGGKRILFLAMMLVVLHMVWMIAKPSPLTRQGKFYLKNLLARYSAMRQQFKGQTEFPNNMDPIMTAALFGVGALFIFSEFSAFSHSFDTPSMTDSSISSDSSSDSSSGCGGGGCGGCGGGGD